MREICTSGSVGGEGGNVLTYPAAGAAKSRMSLRSSGLRSTQTPVAETRARTYSSRQEHHMTTVLTFFSTRTLLQIIFILGSAVAMKAWSLGLLFGG